MKVSSIKCKIKHEISTMVIYICGSYMFEFSVIKDAPPPKKTPSTSADERSTSRKVGCHTQNHKSNEIYVSQEGRWQ